MTAAQKSKPASISQAQSKRIEETPCQMAIACRTADQITVARAALVQEFLAVNSAGAGATSL